MRWNLAVGLNERFSDPLPFVRGAFLREHDRCLELFAEPCKGRFVKFLLLPARHERSPASFHLFQVRLQIGFEFPARGRTQRIFQPGVERLGIPEFNERLIVWMPPGGFYLEGPRCFTAQISKLWLDLIP